MDTFSLNLENNKEILLKCQEDKSLKSCLACQEVLECEKRKSYVKSVYESMNKGHTGQFDFN